MNPVPKQGVQQGVLGFGFLRFGVCGISRVFWLFWLDRTMGPEFFRLENWKVDHQLQTIKAGWWCNVPILKNMSSSLGRIIPYMKWKIKNV
jgi:hypothetical protein